MSDLLKRLSENPTTRKLGTMMGMPLPATLRREPAAYRDAELAHLRIAEGGGSALKGLVRAALLEAGAELVEVGPEGVGALVFDASELTSPASLVALHEFFHPALPRLARSGRVVVLAKRARATSPEAAAAQAALDGFVRSLAKEVGRRGSTANLVWVEEGAEARLAPVLRFLLSPRSVFVTAQPLWVTAQARAVGKAPWEQPLAGKVALVTGAANGIGAATALALVREGARVLAVDRPAEEQRLLSLGSKVGSNVGSTENSTVGSKVGQAVTPVLVDLADQKAAQLLTSAAIAAGGVDIVVNNAGITRDKTMAKMSTEQWSEVLAVNLAALGMIQSAVGPHLRDEGRVVCLSSVAGIAGNVGQTAYAASKAGVLGWVAATAVELAPRGITVNAVAPGFIETRMVATMPVLVREAARRLSALGQGGQPEDVAEAITFLVTPGAHGLTGRHLRVCGGALVGQ